VAEVEAVGVVVTQGSHEHALQIGAVQRDRREPALVDGVLSRERACGVADPEEVEPS
jgi:hypothetical protein